MLLLRLLLTNYHWMDGEPHRSWSGRAVQVPAACSSLGCQPTAAQILCFGRCGFSYYFCSRLIGLVRGYVQVALTAVLTQRLRRQLYNRLIHLPLADLHDMKVGGIQSRLSGDVDSTAGLVQQAIISPLSVPCLLIVVCILLWIEWRNHRRAGVTADCRADLSSLVRKIRPVLHQATQ